LLLFKTDPETPVTDIPDWTKMQVLFALRFVCFHLYSFMAKGQCRYHASILRIQKGNQNAK